MRILAQRQASNANRTADKPKYEYDSDEDIDGGTWEHKKRKHEMTKTAGTVLQIQATGGLVDLC